MDGRLVSTSREGTFQIQQFTGVNRFVQGTAKKPPDFYTLQNWTNPNPGELRSIRGVTKLTGAALVGVSSITYAKFLDLGLEEKPLIVFYTPSVSSIPAPSGMIFSTSGGGATNRNVYLMYVGPGNSYSKSASSSQSIQANGLTVTCPTNVPDYIFCIHVFIQDASANYFWSGSFTRRANVFPTSITCPMPGTAATAWPTGPLLNEYVPASFDVSFGTAGSLQAGRQYYFGIAPWISGKEQETAYKTTNGNILGCYLPQGSSDITVVFDFLPLNVANDNATPTAADVTTAYVCVFMGPTIEDGLIVANNKTDGTVVPTAVSSAQSVSFSAETDVDSANETITVTGNVPENSSLWYTVTSGAGVGGIAPNRYYWTIDNIYDASTNKTTFKLAATFGGTEINITAAGAASTAKFEWRKATILIKELPHSSDLWAMCDSYNVDTAARTGIADPGRDYGIINLTTPSTPTSQNPVGMGCMALTALPHTPDNRREILTSINQKSFTVEGHTPDKSTLSTFFVQPGNKIQARQYVNRIWCANGFNTPFYVNGYVLKPSTVDGPVSGTPFFIPITEFLEFFKDRMILASRLGNTVYSEGFFYYSAIGEPSDFGSTTLQALPVRTGDQSEILGLNIYSQDLSNVGPASFLVIGKRESIFTWNGETSTGTQQIDKSVGFAGPDCYTLTRFGPVYVGRDNIYLLRSTQDIVPIGDNFKDIIQDLSDTSLFNLQAIYEDEEVKIGFTQDTDLDAEIWLRLWYEDGGIKKTWTGPHLMKPYVKNCFIASFGSERNYRVSFFGPDLYRRDDPGSFLNDGVSIMRAIKTRDLGLNADHLLKVINRVYLALRVTQDEDFDLALESQDGSQSIVVSASIELTDAQKLVENGVRQMLQFWIPQRFLARVFLTSIENTSDADMSIYDLSFLFQPIRRRSLP